MSKHSFFLLFAAVLVIIFVIFYKPVKSLVDDVKDPVYICVVDSNHKDGTTRLEDFVVRKSEIKDGIALNGFIFDKVNEFEGEYTANDTSDIFPFYQMNCKKE